MAASRVLLLFTVLLWHSFVSAFGAPEAGPSQLIYQQLEQLQITASNQRSVVRAASDQDLRRFYELRNFAPAWHKPARLAHLVAELEGLADDGLRPEDYAVYALREHQQLDARSAEQHACADILATRAYLNALTHLALGRLDAAQVEPLWRFDTTQQPADPDHIAQLAATGLDDLTATFDRARPALAQYRELRAAFVAMRDEAAPSAWSALPPGPTLRVGASGPRVALLRERLTLAGYLSTSNAPSSMPPFHYIGAAAGDPLGHPDPGAAHEDATREDAIRDRLNDKVAYDLLYDDTLRAAVVQFQRDHHLEADGLVGAATLSALNIPRATRLDQLKANLERLRWLAGDLRGRFVLVDVAGATITYFRDAQPVWSTRTQVGRPARPTPLLKSEITHLTLNPTWTIPPTILRRDKLPEIRRDIDYLARNRIRVLDHSGNELDPEAVDWQRPGAILLRQDAGPDNALGQVAIRFPNPYSVYLHDTPSQRLFARQQRAFSSGCVRVEQAMELVEWLLEDAPTADRARIDTLIASGHTRNVGLPQPVPVLITYWTAQANGDRQATFRPDIYDLDPAIIQVLAEPAPLEDPIRLCRTP